MTYRNRVARRGPGSTRGMTPNFPPLPTVSCRFACEEAGDGFGDFPFVYMGVNLRGCGRRGRNAFDTSVSRSFKKISPEKKEHVLRIPLTVTDKTASVVWIKITSKRRAQKTEVLRSFGLTVHSRGPQTLFGAPLKNSYKFSRPKHFVSTSVCE